MAHGWCWPQSVRPGEPVALHVDGDRAVARRGRPRRPARRAIVWRRRRRRRRSRPAHDWPPGLYVVRLDDAAPTAWFVVRGGGAIVLELATNTWNAYNDVDGPNLYTGAVELSFARPLAPGMLAKDDATPRLVERGYGRVDPRPGADDVARHGRLGRPGAAVRALGRGQRHRRSATRRTPTSSSTPTCSTGAGCCSASATTSTGRGACATRSRRFVAARRQRRLPVRQHVLLAGAHRGPT